MAWLLRFFPFAFILLVIFGIRFIVRKLKGSQDKSTKIEKVLVVFSIIAVIFGFMFIIGF